jgi:hypothetical protein
VSKSNARTGLRSGIVGLVVSRKGTRLSLVKGQGYWDTNIHLNTNRMGKELLGKKTELLLARIRQWIDNGLVLCESTLGFYVNGDLINMSDLYPGYDEYITLFSVKGELRSLLLIGSKTANEFTKAGTDAGGKARIPFTLFMKDGKIRTSNITPI